MSHTSFSSKTLFLLGVVVLATSTATASNLALVPGDEAPGMRGHAPDGARIVVQYKAATVTLLNFWATWCVPCRDEMPALQDLFERRSEDGMQIVGVHTGYVTDEDLEAFLGEIKTDYPIMRPDLRWLQAWGGVAVLPTTVLVDGEGKILRRYIGATEEQIEALIFDAESALEGRELGPIIIPEVPAVATEADKPEPR